MNERFYFRHVIRASHNGPVAKSRSMLNIAIFDPWQRSLFSRQRTPGKEPLLAGNFFPLGIIGFHPYLVVDTSKQRHRLRKKISDEKVLDVAKLISDYNDLTTVCRVEIADALDSNFPWVLPDHSGGKFY